MRFVAAVMLLSVGCGTAKTEAPAREPTPAPSPAARYAVVNGTPQMTRNIMLLDTETGRTWIICGGNDAGTVPSWCPMAREASMDEVFGKPSPSPK